MSHDKTVQLSADLTSASARPACLVQIYGEPLGRRVEFGGGEMTVGRDEDSEIQIELSTVSRRHARLWQDEERACWLQDLGSTNGSLVNGERAMGEVRLHNGDLVSFGGAVFKFIEGGNIESLYHEEIHRMAITDGLTQIANRRSLLEFLGREVARAQRHDRPLCLVMIDVDRFKAVNDQYGHVSGDLVLRTIAEILDGEVRRDELLARYGGEEFAVVLPESTLEQAVTFCERARSAVADHPFPLDPPARITVSLGVAQLGSGMEVEELIELADSRLYRAKETGRNRTVAE